MRLAVYTCITGNYDSLKVLAQNYPQLDFFCFSDDSRSVTPPWRYMPIETQSLGPKDQNRYVKMHPHKVLADYDATLYLDGSIQIVGDLTLLVSKVLRQQGDIFMYEHFQRDCIYDEAVACAHYAHDWVWTIATQMRRYRQEGYPEHKGLFEANVIIRKHSERVNLMMENWWQEYLKGAKRDQLSLPYLSWRNGVPIVSLGKSDPRFAQRYFRLVNHPRRVKPERVVQKYINRTIMRMIPAKTLFGLSE